MRSLLPAALAFWAFATSAAAQEVREPRLLWNHFAVLRLHPIGADLRATVSYVNPIGRSSERLWKTRYWSVGATGTINPAEGSVQAFAQIEPIAVFQLAAMAEYRGYFGTFNALQSFPTRSPTYDDEVLRAGGDAGIHYPTTRWTLRLDPKLRAAVGPIGIENTFSVIYAKADVRAGDVVFYDPATDTLRPADGITLTNTLAVVYLAGPLTAGLLHEWHIPWGLASEDQVHRVGGLASWIFYDDEAAFLNKPRLFSLLLFNVVHRGRVPFVPTFVVGFAAETELSARR